jgi:site-specific recombinase XerD
MRSLRQLKNQFLEYIEIEKGRSIKTVENYDRYLARFLDFIKEDDPKNISDDSVRDFRLWLNRQSANTRTSKQTPEGNENKTLSKKTQNYYLIALRAFLKYLAKQKIKSLPAERIELAKTSERSLDLISRAELERLLNSLQGNNLKNLRDKAILELLFSTGLRVSELCALTIDIDLDASQLSIRGKGGKIRVVFVSEKAKDALKVYLKARQDNMSEALFIQVENEIKKSSKENKNFSPLTARSIERIVRQRATEAGISKKVTPHTMRHMFATDLLSNGADLRSVQALLGHSSIVTTQIYTHVTDKHLQDIHKKFHNRK